MYPAVYNIVFLAHSSATDVLGAELCEHGQGWTSELKNKEKKFNKILINKKIK